MYDRQVRAIVAHGGKVVDGILKNREPANEHHRRQRGNAMKLDWLETTERADGEGSGLTQLAQNRGSGVGETMA